MAASTRRTAPTMSTQKPFAGNYRRLLDLKAWDDHTVVGWMEDDLHHFGLTLVHNGSIITDVGVAAVRHPWSTCPSANVPIRQLIGQPLLARCTDIGRQVNMREQCTHLFDLAGLLSAHAYHRRDHDRYHAQVHCFDDDSGKAGWRAAQLWLNQAPVLYWEVCKSQIMAPPDQAGHSVERGFREWTESMDILAAERASVLRRAVFVSGAKANKVRITEIGSLVDVPVVCHSYQADIRSQAGRCGVISDIKTFESGPEGMLALVNSKP